MGRAQARPLCLFIFSGRREQLRNKRLSPRTPLSTNASLHGRPTPRHSAPRQAQSSCWPAGRHVRPGVTAAPPLTLAAASHWPAGPSLGHACRHYRARPRERQAHIRECLGQQKPVSTQVKDWQLPLDALPGEIVPPIHTLLGSSSLGQPFMPPSCYKVQDS